MKWVYNWAIVSDTSGKEYRVSIADDGTFGCSCPAWTRRRMECKHIKKIKRYKGAEINRAIETFKIPLVENIVARDWVRIEGRRSLLERCTRLDGKHKYCGAYAGGFCNSPDGPCEMVDPDDEFVDVKKAVMSKVDDLVDQIKDERAGKKGEPAPSLMTLITKNAQWRI